MGRPGSSPLARGLRRPATDRPGPGGIIPARAGFTAASTCRPSRPTDHPRSRGVYPHGRLDPLDPPGSSPLARGLRGQGDRRHPGPGIIPARAGFTGDDGASPAGGGDHPRSRGVYPRVPVTTTSVPGSSPLARGLRRRRPRTPGRLRIMPARAGFTGTPRPGPPSPTDHPRSRGVYRLHRLAGARRSGSSPLARGLRGHLRDDRHGRGIIPARAGFTGGCGGAGAASPDHPRSRGVYVVAHNPPGKVFGSSPLARGLRGRSGEARLQMGIIPARAGFTMLNLESLVLDSDHPRSRGVYGTGHDCLSRPQGSSPLARGLRQVPRPTGAWTRIIPARAGFTRSTGSDASPSQDHPRSRGVYNAAASPDTMSAGSSPLARGLPPLGAAAAHRPGIIPARAGFTSHPGRG